MSLRPMSKMKNFNFFFHLVNYLWSKYWDQGVQSCIIRLLAIWNTLRWYPPAYDLEINPHLYMCLTWKIHLCKKFANSTPHWFFLLFCYPYQKHLCKLGIHFPEILSEIFKTQFEKSWHDILLFKINVNGFFCFRFSTVSCWFCNQMIVILSWFERWKCKRQFGVLFFQQEWFNSS